MKGINRAELIYRGFDPVFEELVGFWGAFYKLKIAYPVIGQEKNGATETTILINHVGYKGTFTRRLNSLLKSLRSKKIRGKRKEFTIWRTT